MMTWKKIITVLLLTGISFPAAAQFSDADKRLTEKRAAPVLDSARHTGQPEVTPEMLSYKPVLPGPQHVGYSAESFDENNSTGFVQWMSEKPGYLFLSSALLPGFGQAVNKQWWKTIAFATVEAAAIGTYIWKEDVGRDGEREYQEYAHENFSVVQYSQWIVDYNERFSDEYRQNHGEAFDKSYEDLANPGYEDEIAQNPEFNNHERDWDIVDREALNELERSTHFYEGTGNPFSHHLDPYGSQQYYELISKYYQFGSGWQDWDGGLSLQSDPDHMSQMWHEHGDIGYTFNRDLRIARNMLNLLLVNHFVAALDAFFVGQLRNADVESSFTTRGGPKVTFNYRF